MTSYELDELGFESRQGQEIFFSPKGLERSQGPTMSYLIGTAIIFARVKRPGCEVDHSPPFSVEVKNGWRHSSAPPYMTSWRGKAQL